MKNHQKKAFTLLEVLVSIFIIVLLTAVSLPRLREFQVRNQLQLTALEVKSAILETKNYALAPRNVTPGDERKIRSYAIKICGAQSDFCPSANNYQILECQAQEPSSAGVCASGSIIGPPYSEEVPVSPVQKLPQNINFANINQWQGFGILRFSVEEQGKLIYDSGFNDSSASEVIIKLTQGNNIYAIHLIKATGAVYVTKEQ